ncbi:MAG: aldehyde dehydrogenase (NADP(+)) [Armatimonadota bacterium]
MLEISFSELDSVVRRVAGAAPFLRSVDGAALADLLDGIADALTAAKAEIVPVAMRETHLPEGRLNGECDRTAGQFRNHAVDVRAGRFKAVDVVTALPDRTPPRPHLSRFMIPIGPIAVFGASNFPLAYSVAGGDTASALAAGCPVVVKAHPAHPETSRMVSNILVAQVKAHGFPEGTFQCVHGDNEVSLGLVEHPLIKGVGFTGSLKVGRLLMDAAARRPVPIPVFAEMGSVNPIFVLPGGVAGFAEGYVPSLTLGVGQFCTNPGIVLGIDSPEWTAAKAKMQELAAAAPVGTMLTPGIAENYVRLAQTTCRQEGVSTLVEVSSPGQAGLAEVSGTDFVKNPHLQEEVFGPFGLIVTCSSFDEMLLCLGSQGNLSASVHFGEGDRSSVEVLLHALEQIAGRIVFNGFPTGVEVCEATQHGGPYPASSDSRFTSVGNHAVERWLRPVAYQNAPDWLTAS